MTENDNNKCVVALALVVGALVPIAIRHRREKMRKAKRLARLAKLSEMLWIVENVPRREWTQEINDEILAEVEKVLGYKPW
jgi:glucose-6-phosphate-specific signal transduction histidine kinase